MQQIMTTYVSFFASCPYKCSHEKLAKERQQNVIFVNLWQKQVKKRGTHLYRYWYNNFGTSPTLIDEEPKIKQPPNKAMKAIRAFRASSATLFFQFHSVFHCAKENGSDATVTA